MEVFKLRGKGVGVSTRDAQKTTPYELRPHIKYRLWVFGFVMEPSSFGKRELASIPAFSSLATSVGPLHRLRCSHTCGRTLEPSHNPFGVLHNVISLRSELAHG